ncbi:DNA methyltransferase [Corynebacterium propinquum]|nr:DNA methyltransferase [Corynebacterium propinquum]MDK4240030.1 class I SAM-dependent DNA methyltransferase [Corynebacterium propinquum]MDK4258840.1 class I SAM-dependent DNA methyltransferase [Corynebacterium propinquum]MDK4298721.1 class I SAM-dependent DNA methyltransferase [Corynebacterium propinquum]
MATLSVREIEQRVTQIAEQDEFGDDLLFDLLLAYGRAQSNVTRLRNGSYNVAEDPSRDYAQKNIVYFRPLVDADTPTTPAEREAKLLDAVQHLRTHERVIRYNTRFVIATDYHWLAAVDIKTNENRIFPLGQLAKHYSFFLPWAGMEKAQYAAEKHADTKAAQHMGELFDALVKTNSVSLQTEQDRHRLNVFFTRLLFCYFAEDTGLFPDGSFTQAIASHSREDGTGTNTIIEEIFAALDVADKSDYPAHLQVFPYVNGRLFSDDERFQVPHFDAKSRDLLIRLGRLIWQDINPDIFGSMFQAVVHSGSRSELGQHYTSVPNILKTIEPLFLDELKQQFEAAYDSVPRLEKLLHRIGNIKIFDPACGSGNFLVIAYKELRRLEHAILQRLETLSVKRQTLFEQSVVKIDNFYGIEIDDFATEVAILALWIAKHQMNQEFEDKFGVTLHMIPLRSMGQITCANATRVDWEEICPHDADDEVYLIGNPPYLGSKKRTPEQREDLEIAYTGHDYSKNLDYVSAWFIKGGQYISGTKSQLALVSTNSICQGEHVSLLFPELFAMGLEIGYAYPSFKWTNNARGNAGVTVVVVNLRNASNRPKFLYTNDISQEVSHINGYLVNGPDVFIYRRAKHPLDSYIPPMKFGSMPNDGGNLILDRNEYSSLLNHHDISTLVHEFMGAAEFINGLDRYALWIEDDNLDSALENPEIRDRMNAVAAYRKASKRTATRKLSATPWKFGHCAYKPTESIIVPSVSSERRAYVPIGYLGPDTVISNLAFAIYDAEPWLFALLTSKMHMAWLGAVGGKMKTDYRYSNTIVYNNFPVPDLKPKTKEQLTETALRILDVREYYCENTLAELYDPDKMPDLLREAHNNNDALVDKLYQRGTKPFQSDDERLAELFKRYEEMTAGEN